MTKMKDFMKENNIEEIPLIGNPYELSVEKASAILDSLAQCYRVDRSKMTIRDNKDGTVDVYFLVPMSVENIKLDLLVTREGLQLDE